ncbi:S-layer homology domain-containing protein [Paenibacillus sp. CAU 1782]
MHHKMFVRLAAAFVVAATISNGNAYTSGGGNASYVSAATTASALSSELDVVGNIKTTSVKTSYKVPQVSWKFLHNWSNISRSIQTIVNGDGTVSVLSWAESKKDLEISEFDENGYFIKRVTITKELPLVGAFTRDDDGNTYIFYAKEVDEGAFSEKNMALVKYSRTAEKIKTVYVEAQTNDEKWARGYSGIKIPFASSTCKIEISGNRIAVYFGRTMFKSGDGLNHQASYGFIFDTNTFQRLTGAAEDLMTMPSAGHSFNQFILPIENGFLFVDHGDVGPRGFAFNTVTPSGNSSIVSFPFKEGPTYQYTFAEMGGVAETEDGYLFVGSYEKSADVSRERTDSRNLFILTMNKSLSMISDPVWLTNYTNKEKDNAIFPKIVRTGSDRYVLLWQSYSDSSMNENRTFYSVINGSGTVITPATAIPYVPLNGFDTLRYNEKSGLIQWAVEEGEDAITLYSFDPSSKAAPLKNLDLASNWAKEDIVAATHAQLVPANLLSSYKQAITRADFSQLAIRYIEASKGMSIDSYLALKGKGIDFTAFADTSDPHILAAHALGIVNGTGEGIFNPDGRITREQAAVMIVNMQLALGQKTTVSGKSSFTDRQKTSSWAVEAVDYVTGKGIMNGVGEDRFNPKGNYTREQAILTFNNARLQFVN